LVRAFHPGTGVQYPPPPLITNPAKTLTNFQRTVVYNTIGFISTIEKLGWRFWASRASISTYQCGMSFIIFQ